MNLKDYRPGLADFNEDDELLDNKSDTVIEPPTYHPDINHIRIEKLSKRITMVSIILPCLIGAALLFAYLDIKERLVNETLNKQSEVEKASLQIQEQISALEVKTEKNRFDLESMDKKSIGLEGQIAKITTSKADNATVNDHLAKLDTRVSNNTNQNKLVLQTIDKVNKELASAQTGMQNELNKSLNQAKEEITNFKKELDTKLAGFGELQKEISLVDKKLKKIEQDSLSQTKLDEKTKALRDELNANIIKLDKQVQTLDLKLTTNLSRLQKELEGLNHSSSPATVKPPVTEPVKPKPQVNIDSSTPTIIKQKPLTD